MHARQLHNFRQIRRRARLHLQVCFLYTFWAFPRGFSDFLFAPPTVRVDNLAIEIPQKKLFQEIISLSII